MRGGLARLREQPGACRPAVQALDDWASVQLYARAADDAAPPTVRRGASRRPLAWITGVVALVAVAALAVLWIPPPADRDPSTPTIVAPAPIPTPDPQTPAKITPTPDPQTKTADDPAPDPPQQEPPPPTVDPPPHKRVAPRKPPADGCRPASIPCSADIQDALRAGLGSQPRLDVAVACSGAVTYAPRGEDFAEAVAARARLRRVTGRSPAELPCHVTLPRQ